MILLLKLLLAHLIGDFCLQSDTSVRHKQKHLLRSKHLYWHIVIHAAALALILAFDYQYWIGFLIIISTHFIIDWVKLLLNKKLSNPLLFFIDQTLHVMVIAAVAYSYTPWKITLAYLYSDAILKLLICLILVSVATSVVIKIIISQWNPDADKKKKNSLSSAGKYIGILERLFVFAFIATNHWEAVGFLLAAKSVFRFGDLKEARDRKLTEYILIGTLLSFGSAILIGIAYTHW